MLHNNIENVAKPQVETLAPSSKLDAINPSEIPLMKMEESFQKALEYMKTHLSKEEFSTYTEILNDKNFETKGDAIYEFAMTCLSSQKNPDIKNLLLIQASSFYLSAGLEYLEKEDVSKAAYLLTKNINTYEKTFAEPHHQYSRNKTIAYFAQLTAEVSLMAGNNFEAIKYSEKAAKYYSSINDIDKANQMKSLINKK